MNVVTNFLSKGKYHEYKIEGGYLYKFTQGNLLVRLGAYKNFNVYECSRIKVTFNESKQESTVTFLRGAIEIASTILTSISEIMYLYDGNPKIEKVRKNGNTRI